MIAETVVREIRNLLTAGEHSQRRIAQRLGVSRGTVNAIARGTRPDRSPDRPDDDGLTAHVGPPSRCPGCGGMVQMPCLLCRVRAIKETQRKVRC